MGGGGSVNIVGGKVGVAVGTNVTVPVGDGVNVGVAAGGVPVGDGVDVWVGVDVFAGSVFVAVGVGVFVLVAVGVLVFVAVGVGVKVTETHGLKLSLLTPYCPGPQPGAPFWLVCRMKTFLIEFACGGTPV